VSERRARTAGSFGEVTIRSILDVSARLAMRAGWAPLLVFLFHGTVAGWVIDVYTPFPRLDVPMHVVGGLAIAYFLSSCFAAVPEDVIASTARPLAEAVVVMSLTATTAVLWEFAEFASDGLLGTHLQLGLDDTMRDMACGMAGGAVFLLVRFARGRLGAPAPLVPSRLEPEGEPGDRAEDRTSR